MSGTGRFDGSRDSATSAHERLPSTWCSSLAPPSDTGIPLGFIVNELVTNAAKYGKGQITVRLLPNSERGYALSVSNGGPALPAGFDPAARAGPGLRLVRSLVGKIGGELLVGRDDRDEGARFTVLFS